LSAANQSALDRYTAGHAAVGVVYGALGLSLLSTAALAVAWEVLENPLKDNFPLVFPQASHDSLANAGADVVAVLVGWAAHRAMR